LFAVYGVYIAATDGVARAWIGDFAPLHAGGTAYGIFSAATGAALLAASVTAGILWSHVDPSAPFYLGAGSAAAALVALGVVQTMRRTPR
jgi:MFS family permease